LRAGWYISGAGHTAFILFLLFGGVFARDRIAEVTVAEVSVISEAEFAALSRPAAAPEIATDAPEVAPPAQDSVPEAPAEDTAPEVNEPEAVEVPETPQEPDVETPEPLPDAVVVDTAPAVPAPPSELDGTSLERDAVAAPAPRVAPVPQVAPPPDAETAPERVEDVAPDPQAEPQEQPEPEKPAAPEQASDRIVTEAEKPREFAPASSMRPRTRPPKPVRVAETPREPPAPVEPKDDTADAIAAAVAEANRPAPVDPAPSGPPLTGGEKDALRISVSSCWNVGSLSTEALGTTVIVGVSMNQDGTPETGSIRMVSFSGGSDGAARQAFEAARRAIIRCGARGFPLPVEKYAQWRDIEMTFNPEGMQFR
jgi:hypothetical protein